MNIFAGWCLNNPIAIFLVFVVVVSVLGVRVKMLDTSRCLKMTTANCMETTMSRVVIVSRLIKKQIINHTCCVGSLKATSLNGGIRFEYHVKLIAGRYYRMRSFQSAESTQCWIFAAISIEQGDMIISAFVMRFYFKFVEYLNSKQNN